jgi:predicted ArsR family transcriptional regulator
MSSRKDHKIMERRDKIYKLVLQSGTKGIRAIEIARKLGIHKTVVHRDLDSLSIEGKVESDRGIWSAKTKGQPTQTCQPSEKEIEIELPLPRKMLQPITALELVAREYEQYDDPELGALYRTIIEKERETRTIRIRGKNVDDLDLQRIGNLIQQAQDANSNFKLDGFFKKLMRRAQIN